MNNYAAAKEGDPVVMRQSQVFAIYHVNNTGESVEIEMTDGLAYFTITGDRYHIDQILAINPAMDWDGKGKPLVGQFVGVAETDIRCLVRAISYDGDYMVRSENGYIFTHRLSALTAPPENLNPRQKAAIEHIKTGVADGYITTDQAEEMIEIIRESTDC